VSAAGQRSDHSLPACSTGSNGSCAGFGMAVIVTSGHSPPSAYGGTFTRTSNYPMSK
jgi:hypothetical protein